MRVLSPATAKKYDGGFVLFSQSPITNNEKIVSEIILRFLIIGRSFTSHLKGHLNGWSTNDETDKSFDKKINLLK